MDALTRAWDGRPREQAFIWRLTKGRREVLCTLWTHPLGWELRAPVDGELLRSQAYRDEPDLLADLAKWQAQFIEKGWHV